MPQIAWRMDFSFGHLLTILTMVGGLVIGWQAMVSDVRASTSKIEVLDQRLSKQEKRLEELETNAQTERVRQTEILAELRTDIRYLREAISKINTETSKK